MVSNSKQRFRNGYRLGYAAVKHDGKPTFLRKFTEWLLEWQNEKLPTSERFALSAQTNSALIDTTKCQAALIEERDTSTYSQPDSRTILLKKDMANIGKMSGGRFLVSIKDVMRSENILKMKSLVKEGFNIDPSLKENGKCEEATAKLLEDVEFTLPNVDTVQLNSRSMEISDNVAGYIVHKSKSIFNSCYEEQMTKHTDNENKTSRNSDSHYIAILSLSGLIMPSEPLSNAVARAFGILDLSADVIRRSSVPLRKAGITILEKHLDTNGIVCEDHTEKLTCRLLTIICNCFFNSQRKRSNEALIVDRVAAFKASKSRKI